MKRLAGTFTVLIFHLLVYELFAADPSAPIVGYKILETYPHDEKSFTEGLVFYKDGFIESAGRYGALKSDLRRVSLRDGKTLVKSEFEGREFAEGAAIFDELIFQLTWKNKKIFIYDLENLRRISTREFPFEGWGLTANGRELIASDGTSTIRFLSPQSLETVREITVNHAEKKIVDINELEFVEGLILANIWKSEKIAAIDPETGAVQFWIDLKGIHPIDHQEQVLNGIAWDTSKRELYVTGKNWKKVFKIELVPKQW